MARRTAASACRGQSGSRFRRNSAGCRSESRFPRRREKNCLPRALLAWRERKSALLRDSIETHLLPHAERPLAAQCRTKGYRHRIQMCSTHSPQLPRQEFRPIPPEFPARRGLLAGSRSGNSRAEPRRATKARSRTAHLNRERPPLRRHTSHIRGFARHIPWLFQNEPAGSKPSRRIRPGRRGSPQIPPTRAG